MNACYFGCLVAPYEWIVLFYLVTVLPKITAVRMALHVLMPSLLIVGVAQLFFVMVQVRLESLPLGSAIIHNLAPIQYLVFMIYFLTGFQRKNTFLQVARNTIVQWYTVVIP